LALKRIKFLLAIEILLILMYINLPNFYYKEKGNMPNPSFCYNQKEHARLKLLFKMLVFVKPTIKPKKHGLEIPKYF